MPSKKPRKHTASRSVRTIEEHPDTERMNWLERNALYVGINGAEWDRKFSKCTLRALIDAAPGAEESEAQVTYDERREIIRLWWVLTDKPDGSPAGWLPGKLTLDRLHLVEERLIALGYRTAIDNLLSQEVWRDATCASTWHASVAEKIRALAAVIRESAGKADADAE